MLMCEQASLHVIASHRWNRGCGMTRCLPHSLVCLWIDVLKITWSPHGSTYPNATLHQFYQLEGYPAEFCQPGRMVKVRLKTSTTSPITWKGRCLHTAQEMRHMKHIRGVRGGLTTIEVRESVAGRDLNASTFLEQGSQQSTKPNSSDWAIRTRVSFLIDIT